MLDIIKDKYQLDDLDYIITDNKIQNIGLDHKPKSTLDFLIDELKFEAGDALGLLERTDKAIDNLFEGLGDNDIAKMIQQQQNKKQIRR